MKENLLTKILPKHLIEDVKKVLKSRLVEVDDMGPKKIFHELLVERHDDVRWVHVLNNIVITMIIIATLVWELFMFVL